MEAPKIPPKMVKLAKTTYLGHWQIKSLKKSKIPKTLIPHQVSEISSRLTPMSKGTREALRTITRAKVSRRGRMLRAKILFSLIQTIRSSLIRLSHPSSRLSQRMINRLALTNTGQSNFLMSTRRRSMTTRRSLKSIRHRGKGKWWLQRRPWAL